MTEPQPRRADVVSRILNEVGDLPPDERSARLAQSCAGDDELRAVVDYLLEETGAVLGRDAPDVDSDSTRAPADEVQPADAETDALSVVRSPDLSLPRQVGRYKLLQVIGEGGFGSVFMAEQQSPIRREVAVKVVKAGMDTRRVIARFEAERQALAMMDHPGIAKVLDAGQTAEGRPYFAMELVRGVPITDYCDRHRLTIRERLELFAAVCNAVQHAHQKGIIHRDLKPTNVLVTLHDGQPVPKVIDFGIAKATQAKLTDKTLFTEYRQLIGTPEYMSPEQAEMSGLDIDTRADIYSLGVLLYELLTGATPFRSQQLHSKPFGEIQRVIREVEPPKPSTQLRVSGELVADVAAKRRTDTRRLGLLVRGELDWIVMKCLEKDRTRRYESASAMAADVRNYLSEQPVLARPSTAAYRARKFVSRHRIGVAAAMVVAAAIFVGLLLASVGLIRTRQARGETVAAFRTLRDLLQTEPAPGAVSPEAEETMRRLDGGWLRGERETAATLRSAIGTKYLGFNTQLAERQFQVALALLPATDGRYPPAAADALAGLASISIRNGDFDTADARLDDALEAIGTSNRDPTFVLRLIREGGRLLEDQAKSKEYAKRLVEWELDTYTIAIAQGGRNELALVERGRLLARIGQFDKAAEDLRRMTTMNPAQVKPRILLGYLELYLGKTDAYRKCVLELLQLVSASKENPDRLAVARLCLVSDGDFGALPKLLEEDPSQRLPPPRRREMRMLVSAMLQYRQGQYPAAIEDLRMLAGPRQPLMGPGPPPMGFRGPPLGAGGPPMGWGGQPVDPRRPGPVGQDRPLAELLLSMSLRRNKDLPAAGDRYSDAVSHAAPPTWRETDTDVIAVDALPTYLAFEILKREADRERSTGPDAQR